MRHTDKIYTSNNTHTDFGDKIFTIPPDDYGRAGQLTPQNRLGQVSAHTWETGDWLHGKAFTPKYLENCIKTRRLEFIGTIIPTDGYELALDYRPEIIEFAAGRRISLYDTFFWPLLRELAEKDAAQTEI
jgi:hypothetical protein